MKDCFKSTRFSLIIGGLIFLFNLFSNATLAQNSNKPYALSQLLDSLNLTIKKENIVGLSLGITTPDSVIFTGGLGWADQANQLKVNKRTLFRMGSITKMVVAMGIMQLVEAQKISLNDEIKKIAPEIPFQNAWESSHPLKVVHLLEHTSGFDDIKLNQMYDLKVPTWNSQAKMMVHQASYLCRWPPGERMAYSNPNYTLLGYLLEKFSGQSFEVYLQEKILKPLQMNTTNFNLSGKFLSSETREYSFENGKIISTPSVVLLSGSAGAMWASAEDMVKLLQFFLKGNEKILSAQSIQTIETPQSSLAAKKGLTSGYALGNRSAHLNAKFRFRGHDGLIGTCFSGFYYSRDLGVGFIVSGNSNKNLSKVEALIINYLEGDFGKNKPIQTLQALPINYEKIIPYLGYYQFEGPRNAIGGFLDKLLGLNQIYWQANKLYFKPLFGEASELIRVDSLGYAWQGMNRALIIFTENEQGKRVMLIGGTYYEQANFWEAWAFRGLFILAVLISLSAVLAGFISLLGGFVGKVKWSRVLARLIPAMAIGLFAWAFLNIIEIQSFTYKMFELRHLSYRSLVIFIGTSGLGLGSLLAAVYYFLLFKSTRPRVYAYYWVLVGLSMLFLSAFLLSQGWIGLRTWAM